MYYILWYHGVAVDWALEERCVWFTCRTSPIVQTHTHNPPLSRCTVGFSRAALGTMGAWLGLVNVLYPGWAPTGPASTCVAELPVDQQVEWCRTGLIDVTVWIQGM